MAVTITRTAWIDDDGSGSTGTVINNAVKTSIYNEIDGALAKVAQLTGGNNFTGNQAITGLLNVNGFGTSVFISSGTGGQQLILQNSAAGATNFARLSVGNDSDQALLSLTSYSSTTAAGTVAQPSGSLIYQAGTGGLSIGTAVAAPIRHYTNGAERLRIAPTGEVLINTPTNPAAGIVALAVDLSLRQGVVVQNTSAGNTGYFAYFLNSAAGACGSIQQSGATGASFVTTSDARLKRDRQPAADLTALRAIAVYDFTWIPDGRADRGVFAQEAHAVFPRAIAPGTDDVTAGGDLARPWGTDYSKFVPDLIVGWQQHAAELADLRAALATLKGSPDAQ